ncbi:MAG: DNA-3-methyladenine glycosylase [Actinobacteria bacterium]|nr:DNA-3-methyladenine glycosylase [Actinomycetota bacterium]MCL6094764.1 DNA-3-methyladenine glycosylase [Actinomycetota bacterium]
MGETPGAHPTVLERSFFERDALEVAPSLLGKLLVKGDLWGRIVEVEAYRGSSDPASHAYKGMTKRNATMFGPAGHLYVYFTYGMHWCANIVCAPQGIAQAVLLRAISPLKGIEEMRQARGGKQVPDHEIGSGPAKLCQALGIDGTFDGIDLVSKERGVTVVDDGFLPSELGQGVRIGIRDGQEYEWRWWIAGDPNVSRFSNPRPSGTRSKVSRKQVQSKFKTSPK